MKTKFIGYNEFVIVPALAGKIPTSAHHAEVDCEGLWASFAVRVNEDGVWACPVGATYLGQDLIAWASVIQLALTSGDHDISYKSGDVWSNCRCEELLEDGYPMGLKQVK